MLNFSIIDTAGQENFDDLRPKSYANTDVFVIVFDITNPNSFEHVKTRWYPEIFGVGNSNVKVNSND